MKRHHFSATFTGGATVSRASNRPYTHAWRVSFTKNNTDPPTAAAYSGFSLSFENALKAAGEEVARLRKIAWVSDVEWDVADTKNVEPDG